MEVLPTVIPSSDFTVPSFAVAAYPPGSLFPSDVPFTHVRSIVDSVPSCPLALRTDFAVSNAVYFPSRVDSTYVPSTDVPCPIAPNSL